MKNFSEVHTVKKVPPTVAMVFDGSKFQEQFSKGSHKEQSCEIISKSDQQFQRRRFLKNSLKNSI